MTFAGIVAALILGFIPATIASKKGRDFMTWYIYGFLLFIVALPHSLIISKTEDQKLKDASASGRVPCPFCKELIHIDAVVCPHCQRDLPADFKEKAMASCAPPEEPQRKKPSASMKGQIEWAKNHPEDNK